MELWKDKKIVLELSIDEFLVLDNLINRLSETNYLEEFFEDDAERIAFWNLESILEKLNPYIFREDYDKLLEEAKKRLRWEQ